LLRTWDQLGQVMGWGGASLDFPSHKPKRLLVLVHGQQSAPLVPQKKKSAPLVLKKREKERENN